MIVLPIVFNIIAVVGFYLLEKKTKFGKLSYLHKQLIIGFVFGLIAISSSEFGVVKTVKGTSAIMNVRDASPISAGLIFGPIAGIISGVLGGGYRALSAIWVPSRIDTLLACSISTVLAGIIAAVLRKYMFDDKKPTIIYALSIALVIEVFHMLMLFITNLNDINRAFTIVKICTVPMCLLNALTVGFSVFLVILLSREKFKIGRGREQIAQTFQRWLVITILIAFAGTSVFTNNLQTDMRDTQLEETFKTTISDVIKDIRGKSDANLLDITKTVKAKYLEDTTLTVQQLMNLNDDDKLFKDKITHISLIDKDGVVAYSTDERNVEDGNHFNFESSEQSKEFLRLLGKNGAEEDDYYIQSFQANGFGEMTKYAGITLPNDESVPSNLRGGIIQVSFDEEKFYDNLDGYVIDFTKNRSVGANGFVAVCNEKLELVTEDQYNNKHISEIGITPNEKMLQKQSATQIYTTNIVNANTDFSEEYIFVFTFAEGYCIIAAMPEADAYLVRDAAIYLSVFMQIVVFGTLFVLLYFLIKKVVIDNILKINGTLSKISSGNLNETVNVRSNVEFASLSDDINTTVETLKRYIKEAAARIDKELEYAKQIQLSALPNVFPDEKDYSVYAQMIAAKEVGGDFYDFYKLNERDVAVLVADVSGKGIPAAMFMMTAKTIIKDLAERGLAVNEIFTVANQKLCENNESGMFVTAWMGILDLSTGKLTFANAGHNPPLLYTDGKFEYLKSRAGLVLAGMEGINYRINEITLKRGDRLFLYTDGVTEATNEKTELYGEDRLLEFMSANAKISATDLLVSLKEDIDIFVDKAPQFDDITMLVLDFLANQKDTDNEKVVKTYPASVDALPDLLAFVEESLESKDCSMKIIMSVSVAIEEVFVNVANYAYGEGQGDVEFAIGFDKTERAVVFEMADKGKPFNPLDKPDPDVTLSAEDRAIGGLGIFITKKTMDDVTYRYENGQNILTMKKKI